MNISAPFIRRPVMTALVMAAFLVFGAAAYRFLPVSDLPNVDFPTIQVTAVLPGASPETMASSVATPLERQFSTIAGLDSMSSSNLLGATQITLQFSLERNIDAAAQDVQAAIDRAARQLPSQLPAPPTYQKVNPADQPVLYIALNSPTMPIYEVDEYGETLLAPRISMIGGVAQVVVFGAQKYAVRAQVDPDLLASRGIGINEVADAIDAGNVDLPTGTLWGRYQAVTIKASGQLLRAADYRPLVVGYRNGAPVRLSDLGRVIDSVENDKTAAWFVDQRSVILAVFRQPGTNAVRVSDAVKKLLPDFRREIPAALGLHLLYDRSDTIRSSVNDVQFTLLLTLALVVGVIFVFLRNLSATAIPSLALPISVVGTFAAMHLLGYSLDNLSLMALTLSVGFVADDAIVVLENIVRHMEKGEAPREAALNGSREISFTILSMTLSLVAVFIPVLFMGGLLGRLLHEFSVTIAVAILISGVVSLTLTPMLASRFLRPPAADGRHGALYLASERAFAGLSGAYGRSLAVALRFPKTVLTVAALTLAATVWLFMAVPKGFIPSEDTGQVVTFLQGAQGISFEDMARHQQAAAAVVARDPNVDLFMSSAGARGGVNAVNTGFLFIRLKPRKERRLSADEVIQELRPQLNALPGIRAYLQNPPPVRVGGQLTQSLYQFTLSSPDVELLYRQASILEERLRALPLLQDVGSDLQISNPEERVELDRDKAAALGLTANQIETALYSAYGARQVSTIFAPQNEYQVILETLPEFQRDPRALDKLFVRSAAGKLVPLSTIARLSPGLGPLTVNHTGQLPSVTISFNLKAGAALGDAVAAVEKTARATLPPRITTNFGGAAQAFQSSMRGIWLLLLLAIAVIYLVLGILYESFAHPLTILSGLPSAAVGGLVALLIFRQEMSIYAFVGIIMLIGIVKKNAIMMIDFALAAQRSGGKSPEEAIFQGCLIRFRPIMMTTMAALMAGLAFTFGTGSGAESRRPLGLVVVGGLVFSQLITLFITPVVYLYLERLGRGRGTKVTQGT
jgi:HAE1 family hydrophobic/amphiphilic exporter-1